MIIVNELRILNNQLIIDVEMDTDMCTTTLVHPCHIVKIEIYNQTNYNSGTPLDTFTPVETVTEYQVEIPLETAPYEEFHSTDLFFIKVYWDGTPASDCPCGADVSPENFAVYDKQLVYKKGMKYLSELSNCCADKTSAIDFILTQKYFDLSLNNGAIVDAINLWNKMMNGTSTVATSNCGCHA